MQVEVSDTIFEHPPTTATSLPSEIIDNVMKWAFDSYISYQSNPSTRKLQRKELGQLSLVCKHWARRCRAWMFISLRISNLEDLHTLRNWVTRLDSFVESFEVHLKGSTKPWLHLFNMPSQSPFPQWHHKSKYSPFTILYVDIEQVLSQHSQRPLSFRSVLYSIPRFIPGSLSQVHSLSLSNHHFSSFFDLVHLVRQIPHLYSLRLGNLTWDVPSELLASPSTRRYWARPVRIEAEECPNAHHLVWFYVMFGLEPFRHSDGDGTWIGIHTQVELLQVAELVQQFFKFDAGSSESKKVAIYPKVFVDKSAFLSNSLPYPPDPLMDDFAQQYRDLPWESRIRVHRRSSPDYLTINFKAIDLLGNDIGPRSYTLLNISLIASISKLELRSTPKKIKAQPMELWEELDRQADSFSHLEHFHVQFKDDECKMSLEKWSTECTEVSGEIVQQMTRMQDSGRLRFDAWDWEHDIYQIVTPRT